MVQYVAFLRGINVGGKHLVKMDALRAMFESLGFKEVKTFIQSGNVLFDTTAKDSAGLTKKIEKALLKELGYPVSVMIRTGTELTAMVQLQPFAGIEADGVGYVTFLAEERSGEPSLPLRARTNDCALIHITPREIFTVGYRTPDGRSGNVMALIEKEAGKSVTTRNWNTIEKIAGLLRKD